MSKSPHPDQHRQNHVGKALVFYFIIRLRNKNTCTMFFLVIENIHMSQNFHLGFGYFFYDVKRKQLQKIKLTFLF